MKIALSGNPNSGKTSMYNILTGKNERVGNWAGVTVDKKEARLRKKFNSGNEDITIVDLPGAYSLSPFTSEESITRDYIKKEKPDVIINIVDATNMSRSLFFTTQLLELGIPTIIALNKSDINKKKNTVINTKFLSEKMGCPVFETVSSNVFSKSLWELIKKAVEIKGNAQSVPYSSDETDLSDKEAVKLADKKRFDFVNEIIKQIETREISSNKINTQDKIDDLLTNKWLGLPVFAVIMWFVFWVSQAFLGPWLADSILCPVIDSFGEQVKLWMTGTSSILNTIVVDGIVGGVSAVIGFLPLVMVMYFLISLLEDCGYMARASVVLDPIFKKVGLSGKSIIPFIIGTGCAVPGVMACRTIRDERERKATAMLAPFMPCGAKLPVIALFSGVFFGNNPWIGTTMYFVAIAIIFFGALLINKITGFKNKNSFFIIELPEYKFPSLKRAFFSMCSRGWAYIVKAGTVILVCNAAVTIIMEYNFRFAPAISPDNSILAGISSPIAFLLIPLGFGTWQLAAAAIAGFIAKENVVGTLASVYAISNFINVNELALAEGGAEGVAATLGLSSVAALSYLMFNLFSPPCFAAIGAMNAELKDKKWMLGGISLQFATGYTVSFFVYQIGILVTEGHLGEGFYGGFIAVSLIIIFIINLIKKANRK